MIQMQTRLNVADNTGAKEVMCIKVLGGTRRRTAGLGDVIICSVKNTLPTSEVKKKAVVRPVQVVTFYATTAVTGGNGAVHFAADIYGLDAKLDRVLRRGP